MNQMPISPRVTPRAPRIRSSSGSAFPCPLRSSVVTRSPTLPSFYPTKAPLTVTPTEAFPNQRRHTLGEIPAFPFTIFKRRKLTRYHSNIELDRELTEYIEPVVLETERSISPAASDVSESSNLSYLTSDTYQLVHDMDREDREGHHDNHVGIHKKQGIDPSMASKPSLYRRYSQQVQTQSSVEETDKPMFAVRPRKVPQDETEWDDAELQAQVAAYVDIVKREKIAKGEYEEPIKYDLNDDVTDDLDQSLASACESGYMTPSNTSQTGDISIEPLVFDVPHYSLDELPMETVNPADYPELAGHCQTIPENHMSQAMINVTGQRSEVKYKVNLVVLSYEELEQYRIGFC